MPSLRLAVATRCLNQPLKASLVLASQLGATGIQLDARNEVKPADLSATGRRQFAHLLTELGLAVASIDFPVRRALCDADSLDARIDAIKAAMELAYQLKARIVTVRTGPLPNESDAEGRSRFTNVLNDLARYGNRVGVTLAFGPGRDPAARLVDALRDVREGQVGVNFDPAAFVVAGQSPTDALQTLGSLVEHVIVRDATRDFDGIGVEVPLGRGDVAWDEMLAMLQGMDYRGWLTVDRTQGEDRAGDAGRALKFLQTVVAG